MKHEQIIPTIPSAKTIKEIAEGVEKKLDDAEKKHASKVKGDEKEALKGNLASLDRAMEKNAKLAGSYKAADLELHGKLESPEANKISEEFLGRMGEIRKEVDKQADQINPVVKENYEKPGVQEVLETEAHAYRLMKDEVAKLRSINKISFPEIDKKLLMVPGNSYPNLRDVFRQNSLAAGHEIPNREKIEEYKKELKKISKKANWPWSIVDSIFFLDYKLDEEVEKVTNILDSVLESKGFRKWEEKMNKSEQVG